jgi:hypothetical protein
VEVSLVQIAIGAVGFLGGTLVTTTLRYVILERPKVRLRASVDGRSEAQLLPVVQFTLTNARKEEIHLSGIKAVRKPKEKGEKPTHDALSTEPFKASFRLKGLEQETFKADWDDVYPDGYSIDDVTGFYVEDVATEKRWMLPASDFQALRKAIEPTLKHRREKATWSLTCRSCKAMTTWQNRRPDAHGSYGYGFPETKGWTDPNFTRYAIDGEALCPKCSENASSDEAANG